MLSKKPGKDTFTDRRDFLKLSGMFTTALLLGSPFSSSPAQAGALSSSGQAGIYIAPLQLMEQAARLALGSEFTNAGFRHCLNANINFVVPGNAFKVGVAMPFGKEALLPSLQKMVTAWRGGRQDEKTAQQMAALCGALSYRQVQAALAPAQNFSAKGASGLPEHQTYQDASLLRTYAGRGVIGGPQDKAALHRLFREMQVRTFIRFHTLKPDEADKDGWLRKMIDWRRTSDLYFGELAEAIAQPEADKMKKYITDVRFFDGNDLILKQVSTFARVWSMDREKADRLISEGREGSLCARALADAYSGLIAINDYLTRRISEQELLQAFA